MRIRAGRTMVRAGMLAGIAGAALAGAAHGQTVITQWNFNSPAPDGNTGTGTTSPSMGVGTASLLGGISATFASGDASGGSTDPITGDDSAWQTTGYPAQGQGSGTAGVEFEVSTAGFTGIIVSWDQRHSNTASRFVRFLYSTDGSTFVDGPVFEANASPNGGDTWYNGRTVDLSGVAEANNNPNFRFRIVAVFDPSNPTQYAPSTLTSTYGGGGTQRFDMVTVRGTGSQPTPPTGVGSLTPGAICAGETAVTVNVAVSPGQAPPSTGLAVVADLSAIGGSSAQALYDDQTNGDALAGDGVFTYAATLPGNLAPGSKSLPFTVSDAQGRSSVGSMTLAVANCAQDSGAPVVISAVFGGGGNSGAPLFADFVELHNRTGAAVSLAGWSLQYAPSFSQSFTAATTIALSGSIAPGAFLLVQTNRGSESNGLPFTADILGYDPQNPQSNGVGLANDAGRLALCTSTTPIGTGCADPSIVDFVGYGSNSICFEGAAPAGSLSNVLMALRKGNGCQDSNQNFHDFEVVFPVFPRNSASAPVACGAPCPADFDGNGQIQPADIAQAVNVWFASLQQSTLAGDFDGNGQVQPADVAFFVNLWFQTLLAGGC